MKCIEKTSQKYKTYRIIYLWGRNSRKGITGGVLPWIYEQFR